MAPIELVTHSLDDTDEDQTKAERQPDTQDLAERRRIQRRFPQRSSRKL